MQYYLINIFFDINFSYLIWILFYNLLSNKIHLILPGLMITKGGFDLKFGLNMQHGRT